MKRKACSVRKSQSPDLQFTAEQEQRREIASKLYNSTSEKLTALRVNLRAIERSWGRQTGAVRAAMAECFSLAEQCHDELRSCSHSLYPHMLEEFGLAAALRNYASEMRRQNGLRLMLTIQSSLKRKRLSRLLEITLFRNVEQCVLALWKLPQCRTASVELRVPHPNNRVLLEVRGKNSRVQRESLQRVQAESTSSGSGFFSDIAERVRRMGGSFKIHATSRETVVSVAFPLPEYPDSPGTPRRGAGPGTAV
jgi:signal transduction histidine kinase